MWFDNLMNDWKTLLYIVMGSCLGFAFFVSGLVRAIVYDFSLMAILFYIIFAALNLLNVKMYLNSANKAYKNI